MSGKTECKTLGDKTLWLEQRDINWLRTRDEMERLVSEFEDRVDEFVLAVLKLKENIAFLKAKTRG